MPDEADYLARPVLRGLCRYESLKDGALDLADVAAMNEWLDAQDENEHRAREAMKNG